MKNTAALAAGAMLALLSLGAAAATPAAAPAATILFTVGGSGPQPLGAVRGGVFAPVEADGSKPARPQLRVRFGANAKEERLPLRGMKLYGYQEGAATGQWTVRGLDAAPMDGADVIVLDGFEPKKTRLLASVPLRGAGPAPSASAADKQAARTLVQALLAKQGLPRKSWTPLLAELEVRAVRIAANAAPVLVVTGAGTLPRPHPKPDETSERSVGYLLIAESANGRWTPAFQKTFSGDEGCGPMAWSYLDHADLDGDGTDELIIDTLIFETNAPAVILRRTGDGRWQTTSAGELRDGSDC